DAEAVPVADLLGEAPGDLACGHLRLQVVARHVARRGHEDAPLARPLVLAPAVEEVRHVRVLLGLGDVQLADVVLREHLGERLGHVLLLEHDRAVEVVAVARHRRHVEAGLEQTLRELAGAVGTEVEEDRRVAGLQARPPVEDDRLDELVGDVTLVATADGGDRIVGVLPHAVNDRVERALRPLPPLVAVHRVVAAADGRDPLDRQLGEVADGARRRDVAAVSEGVDPRLLGREAEQGLQVVEVRVDTAVADEAEQVHVPSALERADECRVLEEGPVGDRLVHALEVLVQAAPGADRQVTDLRVPHLTRGEADRLAGRRDRLVGRGPPEPVEDRRRRELDSVPGAGRRAPPAVEDDERYERVAAAARQIASKDSTSSDAPPTSAPSTSDWPRSSAAFSGLTEPPYSTGTSSRPLTNACASWASSGVAVFPVPIAHTGS